MRAFVYALTGILAIKVLVLFADGHPGYFFGDSATYLATAAFRWIPPDRSFLYGLLIRKLAYRFHCLQVIIWFQVVVSAVAAWLLLFALVKVFRVRLWLAIVVALLCAIEPLQLLSERYILTESCANFLFTAHLVLILVYLRRGRLWSLLTAQGIGVLLIGFRISFLPVVLLNSVLPPLLVAWTLPRMRRVSAVGLHLCLALAFSQGLTEVYKHWYGRLISREPALFYGQGAFLVASLSPLIEPVDFPDVSHRAAVFRLAYDPHDIMNRPAQHFLEGGLWPNLLKEIPDEKHANELAIDTAIHAAVRQPIGVLRLAMRTFTLFFDSRRLQSRLLIDEGVQNKVDPMTKDWLQRLYGVSDSLVYEASPTKYWHLFGAPWYWLILSTLPLWPLLCLVYRDDDLPLFAFCALIGIMLLETATLLVDAPTPRFLTSAAWFTLLMLGITGEHLLRSGLRKGTRSIKQV